MSATTSTDLRESVAILLGGLFTPALVAALARDLVSMYLGAQTFVLVVGLAFGIASWTLIEWLDVDRTTFFLASIVAPWPVLLATVLGVLLLNTGQQVPRGPVADVFRYLIGDVDAFFGYGATFMLAGAAAAGGSVKLQRLAERDVRVPDGWVVPASLGLVVVGLAALVVGANLAVASAASISAVGPGVDAHGRPTLDVTVDGPPAELRVTGLAPDGTRVTTRLPRADQGDDPETVAIQVGDDDALSPGVLPVQAGTYRVRITALSGVTVDTAAFTAEAAPGVSVTATETASGPLSWAEPPDRVVGTGRGDTTVGIAVLNRGSFHTRISVELVTSDGTRQSAYRDVTLAPGERVGVVFSLAAEDVDSIRREHGGTVTISVHGDDLFDDPIESVSVELPQA